MRVSLYVCVAIRSITLQWSVDVRNYWVVISPDLTRVDILYRHGIDRSWSTPYNAAVYFIKQVSNLCMTAKSQKSYTVAPNGLIGRYTHKAVVLTFKLHEFYS